MKRRKDIKTLDGATRDVLRAILLSFKDQAATALSDDDWVASCENLLVMGAIQLVQDGDHFHLRPTPGLNVLNEPKLH